MHTLTESELNRYARQILLDDWDIDAQINLKNSAVAIVGMGGLGAYLAPILARAGVGVLHLFDFDVIDVSNLQRQPLYFDWDVGDFKVFAAQKALKAHNLHSQIYAHALRLDDQNSPQLLSGVDLIIDCTDNFAIRHTINRACVQLHLPLLSISAIGRTGQMALFTPQNACYACLFGDIHTTEDRCADVGVLTSTVACMASQGADVALTFLGKKQNPIANTLLLWQGSTLSTQKMHFTARSDCPVCQNTHT